MGECGNRVPLDGGSRKAGLRGTSTLRCYLEMAMCLFMRAFSSSFSCWKRFSLSTNAVLLSTYESTGSQTFVVIHQQRKRKKPSFLQLHSSHKHTSERLNQNKCNGLMKYLCRETQKASKQYICVFPKCMLFPTL